MEPVSFSPKRKPNLNRRGKFFHYLKEKEVHNNSHITLQPHLKHVAALPCELTDTFKYGRKCKQNALIWLANNYPGSVQTLESPEIKMLRFPGLESPGKRHRSWKSPGILKWWSWVHWSTLIQPRVLHWGLFTVMQLHRKLICYVHFWPHATMFCKRSVSWKVVENEFFESWKTRNMVLASSGKQCFNVCTNPEHLWLSLVHFLRSDNNIN